MIRYLSRNIASSFAKHQIVPAGEIANYSYGMELLLSTVISFLILAIIAVAFRTLPGAILYPVSFIGLRVAAGGYHAKTHFGCIASFSIVFALANVLILAIPSNFFVGCCLFAGTASILITLLFAPVDHPNKPMSAAEKKVFRKKSIFVVLLECALAFAGLFILGPGPEIAFFLSGCFVASVSLIAAKLQKKCRLEI